MNFTQVRKLLLIVLSLALTNLAGCIEVEVNTILDQTPMASEGQERPEEVLCKVKLKLTCIAGLVCSRDLSVQKASQSSQTYQDSTTVYGEENLAVTSCNPNKSRQSEASKKLNLAGKTYRVSTVEVGRSQKEESE